MFKSIVLTILIQLMMAGNGGLGAEGTAVHPLNQLLRPQYIDVFAGYIYISDFPNVYIFRATDMKLIKRFGKLGAGPEEFINKPRSFRMKVQPNFIFINSQNKISYFSREGDFIKELNSGSKGYLFTSLEDTIIGKFELQGEDKKTYRTLQIYDSQLNNKKEYFREDGDNNLDSKKIIFFTSSQNLEVSKDRIYYGMGTNLLIRVFDKQGKLIHTIARDYPDRRKVGEKEKEEYRKHLQYRYKDLFPTVANRIGFAEYFPVMRLHDGLKLDYENGNRDLYVITWKQKNAWNECFLYDLDGNFIRQLYLPLKESSSVELFPFTINKGKIYQLVENEEDESWQLFINAIK